MYFVLAVADIVEQHIAIHFLDMHILIGQAQVVEGVVQWNGLILTKEQMAELRK